MTNTTITHLQVSEESQRVLAEARDKIVSGEMTQEAYNALKEEYYHKYLQALGEQKAAA